MDAVWESLSRLGRADAATGVGLVGLHAGGAYGIFECTARSAEACAAGVRGPGVRIIAPASLREAGPGWESMGASAAWQRLTVALGVEGA